MAGTDSGFDAPGFREAITFAMNMGLPQDVSERATFHFKPTRSYQDSSGNVVLNPRVDQNGQPLDPSIRVVRTHPAPVQVPVAVEFDTAGLDERPVGSFKPTKVSITVLDEHWPQVSSAIEVELGGDRYVISYTQPPVGLFDVTIYTMECFARSET